MSEIIDRRMTQAGELPVQSVEHRRFSCRYGYARSADCQGFDGRGEDFLLVRSDERRLAFALCDGVSQSFQADLGARFLGERLVRWIWEGLPPDSGAAAVERELDLLLRELAPLATEELRRAEIPPDTPARLRKVLEQKRGEGTESMFVAGLVDPGAGRVVLAWMGDSRARLWGPDAEVTGVLGDSRHTGERWSSRLGPVGRPHVYIGPLAPLRCVVAYSDGLAQLDGAAAPPASDQELTGLIMAGAAKDDVSYVEVTLKPGAAPACDPPPVVRAPPAGRGPVPAPSPARAAPAPPPAPSPAQGRRGGPGQYLMWVALALALVAALEMAALWLLPRGAPTQPAPSAPGQTATSAALPGNTAPSPFTQTLTAAPAPSPSSSATVPPPAGTAGARPAAPATAPVPSP